MAEADPATRVTAQAERGRPRNADHDAAILGAAMELLIERGPDTASVEAIARRAGVAKLTVYRRWRSKDELLVAAIEHARSPGDEPFESDTSIEDAIGAMARQLGRRQFRDLAARMIGASVDHPDLIRAYNTRYLQPRLTGLTDVARRAIDDGLFPTDSDPEVIRDALFGMTSTILALSPVSIDQIEGRLRRLLVQLGYRRDGKEGASRQHHRS